MTNRILFLENLNKKEIDECLDKKSDENYDSDESI
jgi:hypothetical protein